MKVAYLLVTDLHYAEVKANRVDYYAEVLGVIKRLLEIKDQYAHMDYTVRLVLLGDVVDSSMANPEEAMRCVDMFRYIASEFDQIYSVLGNHEETYITNNPFWFLVSSLDDEALHIIPRALQPKSVYPCIVVPDTLTDGEVTFYFNHYGIPPKVPHSGGVAVGLFHQNVGSNDICKMWGTFDNVEEASYVQAYNYCFFGHMHMAYGKYYLNESETCVCEWLGSCGRTNVTEVESAPLNVNVPAVLIEDGHLVSIEDNFIERDGPDKCIDYAKLKIMRDTQLQTEEIKQAVPRGLQRDTLLSTISERAEIAGVGVLIKLLSGSYDALLEDYHHDLSQITTAEIELVEGGTTDAR